MKVFVLSDLHLKHYPETFNEQFAESLPEAQVLCLCGDYGEANPKFLVDFMQKVHHKYEKILFVMGNHDFWGSDFRRAEARFAKHGVSNARMLNNSSVNIDGVDFFGGTLWYPKLGWPDAIWCDEKYIPEGKKHILKRSASFKKALRAMESKKLVVMSHHLPSFSCVSPKYAGSSTNKFFVNDCEDIIEDVRPTHWFHGHTHEFVNTSVEGAKIVCNPRGYFGEHGQSHMDACLKNGLVVI